MYLKIDSIKKSYGTGDSRVDVLKGVNCGVNKGEICVLLGPSGSGKSTLLNILGGIDKADSGSVTIGDDKLENFNDKQLSQYRRKHLGYIFQSYNLIPNLTVRENIEVGAYLSDRPLPVDELIELLGLEAHKDKRPNQLSGGQQQRTSIGRAIVKNPDLLLCDEPTGALDYNTSKEILKLIEDINNKYGSTIVIVTHNVAISQMAHQVINLHDGRIRSDVKNSNRIAAELIEW
nr:ABC transporter ATP-binding protein [uncultured Mogibacterium sp.]